MSKRTSNLGVPISYDPHSWGNDSGAQVGLRSFDGFGIRFDTNLVPLSPDEEVQRTSVRSGIAPPITRSSAATTTGTAQSGTSNSQIGLFIVLAVVGILLLKG